MSAPEPFPSEIPAQTREIVDKLMKADDVCRLLGDRGETLLDEKELGEMYAAVGRSGINPVLLSFVLILQFLDNNPDRQAAHMVVMRMDWKYALRQELTWLGFDYSSLCNFRKRLYAHGQEFVVFEQLIRVLREAGYIKAKRQRTDATHVLGAIERLSRLELVLETMRLALGALINADARWVLDRLPVGFVTEYSEKREDYRLTKTQVDKLMLKAGADGYWLLGQIERLGHETHQDLPEIHLLKRVLGEQFEPPGVGIPAQPKPNATACGDVIASPHDTDVRYSKKGKQTKWEGYKAQVTETVDDDLPLITDIAIHSAIEADGTALPAIQQRLQHRQVTPEQQYVDRGYCHGKTIASSQQQGIDLRGRVAHQARKPEGFRLEDFEIDLENREAICPQGKMAPIFNPSTQDDVAFHIRFGNQCTACPVRSQCTTEKRGRSLELTPYHDLLTQRRREQRTTAFHQEMHARARIESTICQLVRKHGLRQSRYRGQQKVNLQAAFTAVAVNLKRLARYLAQQTTHTATDMDCSLLARICQTFIFQQRHTGAPLQV